MEEKDSTTRVLFVLRVIRDGVSEYESLGLVTDCGISLPNLY